MALVINGKSYEPRVGNKLINEAYVGSTLVYRRQEPAYLRVLPEGDITVGYEGGTVSVDVESNTNWTIEQSE